MIEKMKEFAREREKVRLESERVERERLAAMSEKELLVELVIEIRKLNNNIVEESDKIQTTIGLGSGW